MEKQATTYFRTSVPDLDTTSVESNILPEAQTDKKAVRGCTNLQLCSAQGARTLETKGLLSL